MGPVRPVAEAAPVLRRGTRADLGAVNRVVDSAIMGWPLPDRVKALSRPLYRYDAQDLEHLEHLLVAQDGERVLGVAAVEAADTRESPAGQRALLLHGLYVLPERQGAGLGRRLVQAVEASAAAGSWGGVLVKAHAAAVGFFEALGYEALSVEDPGRDYPYRFWRAVVPAREDRQQPPPARPTA
jgi:predicted N-acetyltransferase YhbS